MKLNKQAFEHAESLIATGKVEKDSDWSEAQPSPDDENNFLEHHSWDDYRKWFLAVDTEENTETKGHHNFSYGDFDVVHRSGLIAAKQRAGQNDYKEIEDAIDRLIIKIDKEADSVEEASEESFPASDAPNWRGRR